MKPLAHFEIAGAALLLLGLLLVWVGLRGKRIGTHGHCRRCGYDLFGQPAGCTHCPECGRDVWRRRSVRVGRRRRRWAALAAGCFLLMAGGTALWSVLRGWADGPRLLRYVPNSLLLYNLNHPFLPMNMDFFAFDEALHRYERGQIDQREWDGFWQTYSPCKIVVRNRLRQGMPIEMVCREFMSTLEAAGGVSVKCVGFTIDNTPCAARPFGWEDDFNGPSGSLRNVSYSEISGAQTATLSPGPHVLHVRTNIEIVLSLNRHRLVHEIVTRDLTATFSVVPANTPTVRLSVDPSLRSAMKAAFDHVKITLDGSGKLKVEYAPVPTPRPLVASVLVRIAGREIAVRGEPASDGRYGQTDPTPIGPTSLKTADVIFHPDPDAAEPSLSTYEIWGEDIVFPHVPIERTP